MTAKHKIGNTVHVQGTGHAHSGEVTAIQTSTMWPEPQYYVRHATDTGHSGPYPEYLITANHGGQ